MVRNLVKRRLREIYRLNRTIWADGLDIVVIARKAAGETDYATLEADMLQWSEWLARRQRTPKAP